MKKSILVLSLLALTLSINAQKLKESDVPSAVKSKFSQMYPGAKDVIWEIEDKNYEAEFKESGTETSVMYNGSGTYLQTETEISVSSLPAGVSEYTAKNLPGSKINEASKITDANGTISYEAEIGSSDYLFDSSGKFLSKSTDSDTEDEKD